MASKTFKQQIALFRAINVGGSNVIPMKKLIQMSEILGYTNSKSILQSGNLVFEHSQFVTEGDLESELSKRLHVDTDIMIYSADEWKRVIDCNPFKDIEKTDPSHLLIVFLKAIPLDSAIDILRSAIVGREEVHLIDKQLYVTYPDGIGRSKLTNKLIEKHLGVSSTGRNWNTILKINALFKCDDENGSFPSASTVQSVDKRKNVAVTRVKIVSERGQEVSTKEDDNNVNNKKTTDETTEAEQVTTKIKNKRQKRN